jgi:hypothetical protein
MGNKQVGDIPNAKEVFVVFILLILVISLISGIIAQISLLVFTLINFLFFAFIPFIYAYGRCLDIKNTFNLRWIKPRGIILVILIGVLSFGLVCGIISLCGKFTQQCGYDAETECKEREKDIKNLFTLGDVIGFMLIAFLTPISEELFFRGFLLTGLVNSFGKFRGLIYTSLLFGAMHCCGILNIVATALLGIVFGLVVLKTRSILGSIICHAVNNLCAVTIMLYTPWKM